MSQINQETDKMEIKEPQEVLVLTDCVIINIKDYDKLKERLRKYEVQFKELTAKQMESDLDYTLDSIKLCNLTETECEVLLKNGFEIEDFISEYHKGEWEALADKYITTTEELKAQAYKMCKEHIGIMLRVRENERERKEKNKWGINTK